jgi:hypothetical protein
VRNISYLRTIQVINDNSSELEHIVIFNRGLFDQIAWARFLSHENQHYEKVRSRRSEQGLGVNEVFVNQRAINLLNRIYIEVLEKFDSKINVVKIDDTEKDIEGKLCINSSSSA